VYKLQHYAAEEAENQQNFENPEKPPGTTDRTGNLPITQIIRCAIQ